MQNYNVQTEVVGLGQVLAHMEEVKTSLLLSLLTKEIGL